MLFRVEKHFSVEKSRKDSILFYKLRSIWVPKPKMITWASATRTHTELVIIF